MAVNARVWTGSLYGRIPAPSEWDGIQPEYQPNIRELCNEVIARALDACHLMRQVCWLREASMLVSRSPKPS